MKNHFSEFLPSRQPMRRLGQTDATASTGFYSTYISPHLWWMLGSSFLSFYISWKICKLYTSGKLASWLGHKEAAKTTSAKRKLKRNPDDEKTSPVTLTPPTKRKARRRKNPIKAHQDVSLDDVDFSNL